MSICITCSGPGSTAGSWNCGGSTGNSPAAALEKLITYEAVHEITGWEDLRRRLGPDRRCFGFFHPALPGEPLIFVEVALTEGLAAAVQPLLAPLGDEARRSAAAARADTAIFYSISNCQEGLRGVSFGNFLIKQVVEESAGGAAAADAVLDALAGAGLPPLAGSAACRR